MDLLCHSILSNELDDLQFVDVREVQTLLSVETASFRPSEGVQVQFVELHLQLQVDAGNGEVNGVPQVPHHGVGEVANFTVGAERV